MGGIDPQSLQGPSCTRPQYEQHLACCNRPRHCRSHQSRSCGSVRLAGGKQPSARDARGIWGLFHVASIDRRSRRRSQGLYCKTCYRTRRQKGRDPANARPVGGRIGADRGGAFDAANEYEGPGLRNLFKEPKSTMAASHTAATLPSAAALRGTWCCLFSLGHIGQRRDKQQWIGLGGPDLTSFER